MPRKGENIYKRKDNRWEARYIKGYHPDGAPRYGYCYGKTYREARQKLTAAKAALVAGRQPSTASRKKRFGAYCDEWLQLNRDRVKQSTYVKYNGMLQKHIKPHLGGCLLQTLSSVAIEQFSHCLLWEEGLSAKTVKDILTVLHSVLKYISRNAPEPLPMIEIVYPKVPKQEVRVLTRDEQAHFMRYLLKDMDCCKFGVLMALLTGMRIGEICALQWKHICLQEQAVRVKATMQRLQNLDDTCSAKTKVVISEPKSSTSDRIIPLTQYALKLCIAQRKHDAEAFVLTGMVGHYMEPRAMQYKLNQYTADCGLADVHFHTLRHTFATRCVEVDFEIKSLSEILGHSSPKITLERYVHSSMELKRTNMNKLAVVGF